MDHMDFRGDHRGLVDAHELSEATNFAPPGRRGGYRCAERSALLWWRHVLSLTRGEHQSGSIGWPRRWPAEVTTCTSLPTILVRPRNRFPSPSIELRQSKPTKGLHPAHPM